METTVERTRLGAVQPHCCSANNARYRGATVVYRVAILDEAGVETGVNHYATAKWAAEAFAQWLNEGQWDGLGDPEMKFAQYTNPLAVRYMDSDSVKLVQCD